jgi:hypothetical protein
MQPLLDRAAALTGCWLRYIACASAKREGCPNLSSTRGVMGGRSDDRPLFCANYARDIRRRGRHKTADEEKSGWPT